MIDYENAPENVRDYLKTSPAFQACQHTITGMHDFSALLALCEVLDELRAAALASDKQAALDLQHMLVSRKIETALGEIWEWTKLLGK